MTAERTIDGPGLELQTFVAEGGVRCVVFCECGEIIADELRRGVDPDELLVDDGRALGESMFGQRRLYCRFCLSFYGPRTES